MIYPVCDSERLNWLGLAYYRGEHVRDELFQSLGSFAEKIARRYVPFGKQELVDDLRQAGLVGALRNLERFDVARSSFVTFIYIYLRSAIQDELACIGRAVKLDHTLCYELARRRHFIANHTAMHGTAPDDEMIAADLGITIRAAKRLARVAARFFTASSLDVARLYTADRAAVRPEQAVEAADTRACVLRALKALPAKRRDLVLFRYGFVDGEAHTLDETRDWLEVQGYGYISRQRVAQIENKALARLQTEPLLQKLNPGTVG